MPERTPDALRNLRTTLRVAADDLRDLEARIKYAGLTEAEALYDVHEIVTVLALEIADAEAEKASD